MLINLLQSDHTGIMLTSTNQRQLEICTVIECQLKLTKFRCEKITAATWADQHLSTLQSMHHHPVQTTSLSNITP